LFGTNDLEEEELGWEHKTLPKKILSHLEQWTETKKKKKNVVQIAKKSSSILQRERWEEGRVWC